MSFHSKSTIFFFILWCTQTLYTCILWLNKEFAFVGRCAWATRKHKNCQICICVEEKERERERQMSARTNATQQILPFTFHLLFASNEFMLRVVLPNEEKKNSKKILKCHRAISFYFPPDQFKCDTELKSGYLYASFVCRINAHTHTHMHTDTYSLFHTTEAHFGRCFFFLERTNGRTKTRNKIRTQRNHFLEGGGGKE